MAKAVASSGIQTTSWRTILLLVETGLSDINLNSTLEREGCKEEMAPRRRLEDKKKLRSVSREGPFEKGRCGDLRGALATVNDHETESAETEEGVSRRFRNDLKIRDLEDPILSSSHNVIQIQLERCVLLVKNIKSLR